MTPAIPKAINYAAKQTQVRQKSLEQRGLDRPSRRTASNQAKSQERSPQYVGEKLPWDALNAVKKHLKEQGVNQDGVYMAHDSFGVARYGGRGHIFSRLRSHKNKYYRELVYFSFYIIANKTHEHEIENVILRAAGPQMILNQKKCVMGLIQEA